MIYLDSAAVVKLVRAEPCTVDLLDWLDAYRALPLVSSVLVEVEASRALRRCVPQALGRLPVTLARLYRLEINATVRAVAAAYDDPQLRSLDAVHLATATVLTDQPGARLEAFVTYDKRLLAIAARAGLPTASPGV
ncbi:MULTISPECIES: type II toxin-antitoxin system VapC family toxin [Protofrankia]|uniref:Ribonuclease VapC n=1 Tax=Protofrankia coriariae TaxID=1562887 RepID=A0ABR5F726_9ACTN|nr:MULTISPECIES: type II toxin-antitoxin system VapC family toxin [Protofrankia]KLL12514.1 ribonuclease [Protofrankia coriariae]ONH35478.1 VapC toxin family PIN domain ribonuclease [Protofrankia sp. BMG5.30]